MSETSPEKTPQVEEVAREKADTGVSYRSPLLAWVAVVLTIGAWLLLVYVNGYASLVVSALGIVAGFMAVPGRAPAVRNLAITAIIASTVLLVVLAAFLIVIKIGLAPIN